MQKQASQIAIDVLAQVATTNAKFRHGISRVKMAAKKEEPAMGLPALLGAGAGAGTAVGGGLGLLKNLKSLLAMNQLGGRLPELEAERAALKARGLDNRKLLKNVLNQDVPKEMYYDLRKGYERGLLERSRVAKTLRALKGTVRKSMLRNTLLGAGAGLGAGLLGATVSGHFD